CVRSLHRRPDLEAPAKARRGPAPSVDHPHGARRRLRARVRGHLMRAARLRAALDATVGRRLLVRIWVHGFLLFAGVMITIIVARYVLPGHDAALAAHTHPQFAVGLLERVLAVRSDPAVLVREVRAIGDELSIDVTVYSSRGAVLAT